MARLRAVHHEHQGLGGTIHTIFSNPITATLAIVIAIAYIIDRQLKPRPLDSRELLLIPLALLYFGANALWKTSLTTTSAIDVALSIAIGIYLGYKSLSSMKLYADKVHGEAMIEGTITYLKWFALSMVCRLLVGGTLYAIEGKASLKTAEAGFLLSTGAFVGMRSIDLYYKAERLGIPLARRVR